MDTIEYPARVVAHGNEHVVTFPDLPYGVTSGDSYEEAVHNAADCLGEVLTGMLDSGDTPPTPSYAASNLVAVPSDVVARLVDAWMEE